MNLEESRMDLTRDGRLEDDGLRNWYLKEQRYFDKRKNRKNFKCQQNSATHDFDTCEHESRPA